MTNNGHRQPREKNAQKMKYLGSQCWSMQKWHDQDSVEDTRVRRDNTSWQQLATHCRTNEMTRWLCHRGHEIGDCVNDWKSEKASNLRCNFFASSKCSQWLPSDKLNVCWNSAHVLSSLTRDSHTFVKCFGWNLATNSCRCIYQAIYYGRVLCDEVSQRKAVKQTYEASVEGAKKANNEIKQR